jgi:CubicO group peptidase (beta-lactamase class C family)
MMMIQSRKTAACAAAFMFALVILTAGATDDAVQQCVANKAAQDGFSGAVTVSRNGTQVVSVVRGNLAGDDSTAMTVDTRFNLGSASKMFTAVAIGQLMDAGKIRLDDPIGAFVKGLAPETVAVTIRQLLTHSSGLGDFFKPENMTAMLKARTASDLLPLVAHDTPKFPPGSQFAYSNTGFALLGVVIERVSGLSFGDYLARHIFAPAGMTQTGLDPRPLATLAVGMTAMQMQMTPGPARGGSGLIMIRPVDSPRVAARGSDAVGSDASGQARSSGTPPLHPAPGATEGYGSPAGGLFSTAGDMEKFARAFLSHRLTSAATAATLTAPHIVSASATADRPERHYGLGFGIGVDGGHTWFGHNGGTPGANTEFAVFPEDNLTISVLVNRDPPMATAMFAYVKKLLFDPSLVASCGVGGEQ